MRIEFRTLSVLTVAGALALTAALAPAASADPVVAKLRVEADGKPLDPGTSYASDTLVKRTSGGAACGGTGQQKTLEDANAMGILGYAAQPNDALAPLRISDRFSFGLLVCGVGDFLGFDNSFWVAKLNHQDLPVSADQVRLERGDELLWYFVEPSNGSNTGNELVLRAPARVMPGQPFEVTVHVYSLSGEREPAAGVRIIRGGNAITNAQGKATVTIPEEGRPRLRAVRGNDIPSAPTVVCVKEDLDRCPAQRGELIFGTTEADRILGTRRPDEIFARRGSDRIIVVGGDRDEVRCGRGDDVVRAEADDFVARDCEEVTIEP